MWSTETWRHCHDDHRHPRHDRAGEGARVGHGFPAGRAVERPGAASPRARTTGTPPDRPANAASPRGRPLSAPVARADRRGALAPGGPCTRSAAVTIDPLLLLLVLATAAYLLLTVW